ncbi:MAG: hypothetical protein KAH32_05205 [Chlamydiia bacterium]|nr:hypothetical protein [Chlamydiia bacterium]
MTVRELYRNTLIELNKVEAPSFYLEDFLYFANKAVNWYVNTRYNLYDVSQQLSDDLRALRVGPEEIASSNNTVVEDCLAKKQQAYEDCVLKCIDPEESVPRPECLKKCNSLKITEDIKCAHNLTSLEYEYRHLLNCIVSVRLHENILVCDQAENTVINYAAKRLTADRRAAILNNTFLEPRPFRPYYDIHNNDLEILTGTNVTDNFTVTSVTIEYLRNPSELHLDASDLSTEFDYSAQMEFPEYVCVEILNSLVTFALEQVSDPRISSNPSVNQSVGPFGHSSGK